MENYYRILGIPEDADEHRIKQAYRKNAKERHPDTKGTAEKNSFIKLKEAYETLCDYEKRKKYDKRLKEKRHGGSQPSTGPYADPRMYRRPFSDIHPNSRDNEASFTRSGWVDSSRHTSFFRSHSRFDELFDRFERLWAGESPFSGGRSPWRYASSAPENLSLQLILSPEEACVGGAYTIPIPKQKLGTYGAGGVEFSIRVPKDVPSGSTLRYPLYSAIGVKGILTVEVIVG